MEVSELLVIFLQDCYLTQGRTSRILIDRGFFGRLRLLIYVLPVAY